MFGLLYVWVEQPLELLLYEKLSQGEFPRFFFPDITLHINIYKKLAISGK